MIPKTHKFPHSKFFKDNNVIISNMNPGDPKGSPDESFFSINYLNLMRSISKWKIQ